MRSIRKILGFVPAGLAVCLLLLVSFGLSAAAREGLPKWPIAFPSDLGPETIDASRYPKALRDTYAGIFQKRCVGCHGAARVFNSPLVELSASEERLQRREHPGLFAKDILAAGPETWKIYLKEMRQRPACCGGCSAMTLSEIKDIYAFVAFDSRIRKTGRNAPSWIRRRKGLINKYQKYMKKMQQD